MAEVFVDPAAPSIFSKLDGRVEQAIRAEWAAPP
jgi:hypothetical protein